MSDRVFTDQELEEMGALTLDRLKEAIDEGDAEKAKTLADAMYKESLQMHDMYVDWSAGFMDWIYRNHGNDALLEAQKEVYEKFFQLGSMPDMRYVPFAVRAAGSVRSLKGHQQPLKIEEDDEKISITMVPCGSGERLYSKGRYAEPFNLSRVEEASPMTIGRENYPIYCTHEAVIELLAIENLGYPITVCFPGENVAEEEGGCTFCIYKDFADIPEEVWTRVGKEKPDNLSLPLDDDED